jgi:hypothetical protein
MRRIRRCRAADGARARRHDLGTARAQRHFRAQRIAGRDQDRVGTRLRGCGETSHCAARGEFGQVLHYLTGAQFHALTTADYKFKGELIHRLGLGAQ